jgi:hypothetical protein
MKRSRRRAPVTLEQDGSLAGLGADRSVGATIYEWWNPQRMKQEQDVIYGDPSRPTQYTEFGDVVEVAVDNTLEAARSAGAALTDSAEKFLHFAKWALIGGLAVAGLYALAKLRAGRRRDA